MSFWTFLSHLLKQLLVIIDHLFQTFFCCLRLPLFQFAFSRLYCGSISSDVAKDLDVLITCSQQIFSHSVECKACYRPYKRILKSSSSSLNPSQKPTSVDYVCNFTEEDVFYGSIQNTGNGGVERYRRSMGNHEDLRVRR